MLLSNFRATRRSYCLRPRMLRIDEALTPHDSWAAAGIDFTVSVNLGRTDTHLETAVEPVAQAIGGTPADAPKSN